MVDVLVIGGGNAALCAALMAREAGASVLLLEAAPRAWRGGNSGHTRNLRCMHDAPQDVLVEAYPEEEFWQDLRKVTGGLTNEHLARLVIRASSNCRDWMRSHGVHFQPSLAGALHTARTNAFFMGGGKALVNAYYRSAEKLGVQVRYESPVDQLEIDNGRFVAAYCKGERITAKTCVLAAGGFESNRDWLREAWGQNERGEWPSDNFLIRGTAYNQGVLLRHMLEDHRADRIGDPTQAHMVAIDARAPLYDGGICTRIDCVSLGVVVNRDGKRFYDEGEDFWPKRYAIWGRLVAQQPDAAQREVIEAMIERAVTSPDPTEDECRRHYEAQKNRLIVGQALHVRHILFAVTPGVNVHALSQRAETALLELSRNGQQIILATHDYVLLKWFDLLMDKGKDDHVRFHSLYRDADTSEIKVASTEDYLKITPNPIDEAFGFLINQEIENDMGGLGK